MHFSVLRFLLNLDIYWTTYLFLNRLQEVQAFKGHAPCCYAPWTIEGNREYSAALSASVYQDMKGFHRLDSTHSHHGSIGNVSWHAHMLTLAKATSVADDVTQVGFSYKRVDSINGLVHWKVQSEWTLGGGICRREIGQWWYEFERCVFSWALPLFLRPICHQVSHCVLRHSSYHNALLHHTGPEGTEPNAWVEIAETMNWNKSSTLTLFLWVFHFVSETSKGEHVWQTYKAQIKLCFHQSPW